MSIVNSLLRNCPKIAFKASILLSELKKHIKARLRNEGIFQLRFVIYQVIDYSRSE